MAKIVFDIRTAGKIEKVYDDHGTKAPTGISVFQAAMDEIPDGYYIIGQVAVRQTNAEDVPVSSVILVKPSHPDLIKHPVNYHEEWNDKRSGGAKNGSFWRVNAPKGYVALGDVVTNSYLQPSAAFTAKYACIREDLVVPGVLNPRCIWNDKGSGARLDGSVWQVDGPGLAGFFKVENDYQKPALPVFVLPAKTVQEK
jgi:hypothetical protein